MATKKRIVRYEDVLRAHLSALRGDHMSRGAIEFGGFAAGTGDQVADLVEANRRLLDSVVVALRWCSEPPDQAGVLGALRIRAKEASAALDALDQEAQP